MAIELKTWRTMANNGTSLTMPAFTDIATDDLILVLLGKDGSSGTWVESGSSDYTAGPSDVGGAGNINAASFYRKATSGSETPRIFDSGVSTDGGGFVLVFSGVDTTTAFDDTGQDTTSSSGGELTTTALTTTVSNTVLVWFAFADGGRSLNMPSGYMGLNPPPYVGAAQSNGANCVASWSVQPSSGASVTPSFEFSSDETGQVLSYALNPASTTDAPPFCDTSSPPTTIVHPMRGNLDTGNYGGTAFDPTGTVTAVDGESTVYDALVLGNGRGAGGLNDALSVSISTSTTGLAIGGWDLSTAYPSGLDISGDKLAGQFGVFSQNRLAASTDNKGYILGLRSGTVDYMFWKLGGVDSVPAVTTDHLGFVIDVDGGYEIDELGTFDSTDVTGIVFGFNKIGQGATVNLTITEFHTLNRVTALGGSSSDSAGLQTLKDGVLGNYMKTFPTKNTTMQQVQIGDGSTKTYWKDDNEVLAPYIPGSADVTYNAAATYAADTLVNASANCTMDFTGQTHKGNGGTPFEIDASSSSSATYVTSGWNLIDRAVVFRDVFTAADGITFVNCTYTGNSADLSGGCTFDGTPVTVTSEADYANYANCTLKNSAAAITITGNQSHTGTGWDDALLTVSGNTKDITYTGTTHFSIQSAATLSVNNTSSGTCTIVTPTFDLTVDIDQTGCQIHVYTTNTQTTLDTEASAAQLVYTHSSETVDITVLKDGYIPYRQTGLALSGNVGVDVQLAESREYDSSHGLTYTTDAAIYANYNIITGITQAATAVVTYSGADNFSNSDIISIHDVVGMTEVNGNRYTVANVDTGANTFELSGINSSAFTAYTSAGIVVSGLSVPTFGPSAVGVFSLIMEQHRTNSALYNLPFNLQMDGAGALYLANGVEGLADADIERMTAAGIGYLDVDSTQTATWVGIESVGTIPGTSTGEWTADDATTVTDARASGVFDEIIKIHGDADHDNFDNRANRIVMKMNINGYREERVDVRALYGVSGNFKPAHYVVPIAPAAIQAATGDPALTTDPVITDHATSVQSWNGKNFLITITDGATPNTGEDILRHLNYFLRSANDTTLDGNAPFSWPEMVSEVVAGTSYETLYGYTEDAQTSTLKGVRVVKNDGSTAHPDFTRFQSNDGTYYTAPITSNISITGMPTAGNEIRLQITNETAKSAGDWTASTAYSLGDQKLRTSGIGSESTAGLYMVCTTAGTSNDTEPTWDTTIGNTTADTAGSGAGDVVWTTFGILFYDADPSSASLADSYTDGEEFSSGDTYGYRFAELNTTSTFKIDSGTGLVGATGFSVVVNETADAVYAINSIDGSSAAVTNIFTADYTNDYIRLDMNLDFTHPKAFAFYCYELTTSQGMYDFWGGVTAIDSGNYRNNQAVVDIQFDETTGDFVKQEDSDTSRWFKADGTRPYLDPTTGSGGTIGGIAMNWKNPVYTVSTGSGLSVGEQTELSNASSIATLVKAAVITNAAGADVAADIIAVKAETALIVADTGELQTDWVDGGRLDTILDATATQTSVDTIDSNVDAILVDTGTTIPATLTAIDSNVDAILVDTGITLPAQISGVETKIDTVDVNIDGVKAKTDDLTFTKANELDANIQSVNGVTVTGVGSDADPWGSD